VQHYLREHCEAVQEDRDPLECFHLSHRLPLVCDSHAVFGSSIPVHRETRGEEREGGGGTWLSRSS
jgi:hypothetical protein